MSEDRFLRRIKRLEAQVRSHNVIILKLATEVATLKSGDDSVGEADSVLGEGAATPPSKVNRYN